jgi:hypothetical protein
MLIVVCSGQGSPHVGASRFAVVAVGHGYGPLKALLVPLFVAFYALLLAMGGDVKRHLCVTARGHLPASLGWMNHDCVTASGALGGNAVWLLERVPEEVAMSALPRALRAVLG